MSARTQGLRLVSFTMVLLVLGLAATTSADTIHVCWDGSGDYVTIQEGIDAGQDGDADQSDLGILLAHWGEGCE